MSEHGQHGHSHIIQTNLFMCLIEALWGESTEKILEPGGFVCVCALHSEKNKGM